MSRKDADELVSDLRKHFAETGKTHTFEKRRGHWHILNENGKTLASFGSTPSDNRFRKNAVATLRQRGIIPHDWRG
jgi:hypothetical protein